MNGISPAGMVLVGGLVGFALSPAVQAQDQTGGFPENTLAGIYELALENDLTLEQARAQLRAGLEERKLALSGLLPRIQGSVGYSETSVQSSGSFPIGGQNIPNQSENDTDSRSWDISLRQPVFDLPAWFRFQQGTELSKLAEAGFVVEQQSLITRTVVTYFGVLRAAANLQASRSQEAALRGQLEQVQQRFEVGMVAITDVYEAQAAYDLARAQRIADEGDLGIRQEQLGVLTGRVHGDLWKLDEAFPVVDPDPISSDQWVQFALHNSQDIQVALRAREAAAQGARAAASEWMPRVDLALLYADLSNDIDQRNRITGDRSKFPSDQERSVIALTMTMPIYTGGFVSANRRQAEARADGQRADYDRTIRVVTQETRALHIRVLSDVARNAARAQAVISTRSALEAAQVGYEVGTRNVVDVLNAQREHFSAIRDYENSIVDYVDALVLLKRLAGTLSPADIYELNRWLVAPPPPSANGSAPTAS
jgi:outer membrane protein